MYKECKWMFYECNQLTIIVSCELTVSLGSGSDRQLISFAFLYMECTFPVNTYLQVNVVNDLWPHCMNLAVRYVLPQYGQNPEG